MQKALTTAVFRTYHWAFPVCSTPHHTGMHHLLVFFLHSITGIELFITNCSTIIFLEMSIVGMFGNGFFSEFTWLVTAFQFNIIYVCSS